MISHKMPLSIKESLKLIAERDPEQLVQLLFFCNSFRILRLRVTDNYSLFKTNQPTDNRGCRALQPPDDKRGHNKTLKHRRPPEGGTSKMLWCREQGRACLWGHVSPGLVYPIFPLQMDDAKSAFLLMASSNLLGLHSPGLSEPWWELPDGKLFILMT